MNEASDCGPAASSIIVLGVGNTLMQDDGVGIRTVKALAETYDLPPRVRLVDAGVASFGLLPELIGASYLIVVDAVKGKGPPGTLYRLKPEELARRQGPALSAHEVGICEILEMAGLLGRLPQTVILGVEPLETSAVGLDLTAPLRDALPCLVEAVVAELRTLGVEAAQEPAAAAGAAGGAGIEDGNTATDSRERTTRHA